MKIFKTRIRLLLFKERHFTNWFLLLQRFLINLNIRTENVGKILILMRMLRFRIPNLSTSKRLLPLFVLVHRPIYIFLQWRERVTCDGSISLLVLLPSGCLDEDGVSAKLLNDTRLELSLAWPSIFFGPQSAYECAVQFLHGLKMLGNFASPRANGICGTISGPIRRYYRAELLDWSATRCENIY